MPPQSQSRTEDILHTFAQAPPTLGALCAPSPHTHTFLGLARDQGYPVFASLSISVDWLQTPSLELYPLSCDSFTLTEVSHTAASHSHSPTGMPGPRESHARWFLPLFLFQFLP